MGWDRRGYYRRNRKVNGKVVTEYCGGGAPGQLCADMDLVERERREAERLARRDLVTAFEAVDDVVADLDRVADDLARAVLAAAGCHQHHRGEWRRRRDPHTTDS